MSAAAPWSVKGIDPKAREIAKDLARRSGLTLGDFLNRMILEVSPEEPPQPPLTETPSPAGELVRVREALEGLSTRVTSAEHRSTLAISGIDQTVLGLLSRLENAEREHVAVAARFEGALDQIKTEQTRAGERMAKVEEVVAQPRSVEALRTLEAALGKVAAHLYESESRTREDLTVMRADLGGLTQRVVDLDQAEPAPSQEMIDGVVARIVERLEQAEARTSGAIKGLEASVSDFDHRLSAAEAGGDGPEQRLEELAAGLLRNFDEKLEQAGGARLEAMERTFQEVTGQVRASEQRSTQAMERVGREVLRVAEVLGRRMEGVEARSAEAIGQVGGEISRIADAFEGRLRKADQAQAESLERLGVEIARITERLADRIANSERRSAQAVDDVGEQVSRITERLNQRHERASTDLADRIRQSEERTARLLEEAREKIDRRLAGTERRLAGQTTPPPAPPASDFSAPFAEPGFARSAIEDAALDASALEESAFEDRAFEDRTFEDSVFRRPAYGQRGRTPAGYVPLVESLPPEPERSPFEGDDFDAAEMFEAFEAEAEAAAGGGLGGSAEAPAEEPLAGYYENAAAAARLETEAEFGAQPLAEPAVRASTRELIAQAHAAAQAAAQAEEPSRSKLGLFSGFGIGKSKPKWTPSRLKTGVMMAAGAAVLGVSALGATLFYAQRVGHPHGRSAGGPVTETLASQTVAPIPGRASPVAAQAAVALAPQVRAPGASGADVTGLYASAVRRIEDNDNAGVADLRRAAGLGYAPAQFYLARLYEGGQSGLAKDVAQARLWTQRAAENGDRKAMHNLALYYFEGTGGPKDAAVAAQWFQRAANLGLVDSQYNLAALYEQGLGVSQNPAEAYKWYLIAGRSGDGESRAAADRLQARLSPDVRATAQHAAQAFRAAAAPAEVAAAQDAHPKAAG